jgi:hypothetical protein
MIRKGQWPVQPHHFHRENEYPEDPPHSILTGFFEVKRLVPLDKAKVR